MICMFQAKLNNFVGFIESLISVGVRPGQFLTQMDRFDAFCFPSNLNKNKFASKKNDTDELNSEPT